MYPIFYSQVAIDSIDTPDLRNFLNSLGLFITKLNDKLVFPDQIPTVKEIADENGIMEGK
jgi:hypothetical protein